MKIKMYSKKNVCLAPTYICNVDCPFCYARLLKERFKNEMSWETFKKVADRLIEENKNEVSFVGGEPTRWEHINRAVFFLKKRNIQVNFFTNGLVYSEVAPDCVLINIYNYFNQVLSRKIRKTINFYKKNGTEVGLRYTLVSNVNKREDELFFELAPFADYISLSLAVPYVPSRDLGNRIFELAQNFYSRGKAVKISRAMPICLFNSAQFRYLRKNCSLQTECFSEKNIVINPDGETVFPCVNISAFAKNLSRDNFKKIEADYKLFFENLRATGLFSKCRQCEYGRDKRCQAGCLGARSKWVISAAIKRTAKNRTKNEFSSNQRS